MNQRDHEHIDFWLDYKKSNSIPQTRPKPDFNLPKRMVGQNIHIKSKQGVYYVESVDIYSEILKITCKKWITLFESGIRDSDCEYVPLDSFKCFAGGFNKFRGNPRKKFSLSNINQK